MENTSKILDKIKKLLLHQQSAEQIGSIEEAEAFAAKIQSLLAKHNLSIGQIDFKQKDSMYSHYMSIMFPTIGGQSAYDILYPIAKYNWCHVYFYDKAKSHQMMIVGTPENVEVCQYIFKLVAQALIKICKEEHKQYVEDFISEFDYQKYKETKPIGYDTYARAFMRGAGIGLAKKLKAEQDSFKAKNENAHGLVLYNSNAVSEYVQNNFRFTKGTKTSSTNMDTDAYHKGKTAGENVNYAKGVGAAVKTDYKAIK